MLNRHIPRKLKNMSENSNYMIDQINLFIELNIKKGRQV